MILELTRDEKEFFYPILFNDYFGTFSPFEIEEDVDFPNKDELGGDILKFIGGGSAYFKMQTEMPSPEEIEKIRNVALFLKEKFGEYVVVNVLCTPDIEIRDINLENYVDIDVDFISARKSNGDQAVDNLLYKLENNKHLSQDDHFLRILLPFMGHTDDCEFETKYSKVLELYSKCDQELPNDSDLMSQSMMIRFAEMFKRRFGWMEKG